MASLEELVSREFNKGATPAGSNLEELVDREFSGGTQRVTPSSVVPQESLGPPGMEDVGTRFSVGEGRNFQEKYNAFRQAYPEGDLAITSISNVNPINPEQREIGSEKVLLFRKSPKEPYAKVDAGMFEKNEPLGDIVDFAAQDIGSIIGQIGAIPTGKPLSLLPLMLRSFGGAASGDIAQQGIQQLRGINTESAGDVIGGSVMKGIGAAGGAGLGAFGSKLVNAVKGGGFLRLERGADDAIEAGKRLGAPPVIAPQVALNPSLKKAAGQAAAASGSLKQYIDDQGQAALRASDTLRSTFGPDDLSKKLTALENFERSRILAIVNLPRRVETTESGRALQQSVEKWNDLSKVKINDLYSKARSIDQPIFDIRPVQSVAQQIEEGVQTRGLGEKIVILGADAKPLSSVQLDGGLFKASKLPKESQLLDVIETIKQINPNVSELKLPDGRVIPAHDQLNAVRMRLYDLKTPPAGEKPRIEHAQAGKLYSAITNIIENPVNKNPQFVVAWRNANKAAAQRFETLDKIAIMKAIKEESPSQMAERILKPGNAENLAVFRKLRRPDEYQTLVDSFKTKLLDDADNIVKTIDSYDKPTLNLLLSKEEQGTLRDVGSKIQRLNDIKIREALAKDVERGALASDIFKSGDTRQIAEFSSLLMRNGGIDSPYGRSVRAGIIDDIFDKSIVYSKSGRAIDFGKLNGILSQYEKVGLSRFLKPSDIQHLKDQRMLSGIMKSVEDAGTSIAGAEAAGNVVFRTSERALYHMARLMGFGRLLTMAPVNRFLIGKGSPQEAHMLLKLTAGALGSTLADLDRTEAGASTGARMPLKPIETKRNDEGPTLREVPKFPEQPPPIETVTSRRYLEERRR